MEGDNISIPKRKLKFYGIIFAILIFLVLAWFISDGFTEYVTNNEYNVSSQNQNGAYENSLEFLDNTTNCTMNGYVYLNNISQNSLLGETRNGIINITKEQYDNFSTNWEIILYGTTDSCFGKDANLPFLEIWYNVPFDFSSQRLISMPFSADPRHPKYYLTIEGFIRPDDTLNYYNTEVKPYLINDTGKDLDRVTNLDFNYRGEGLVFGDANYWRTPGEVLSQGGYGDCKNWAVTVLSLIKNYNSSLECYGLFWAGDVNGCHMNVFCHYGDNFAIYDQDGISSKTTLSSQMVNSDIINSKIKIREMINSYTDKFGLSPENHIVALVNDKEVVTFNETGTNEDFVNWAIGQVGQQ